MPVPMRRSWLAIPVIVLVVLVAGFTGYWFYGASLLRGSIDTWMEEQQAQGTAVQTGALSVTGFPLTFTAHVENFMVRRPDNLSWAGESLNAWARPWAWHDIALELDGRHMVSLPVTWRFARLALTSQGGDGALHFGSQGELAAARIGLVDVAIDAGAAGTTAAETLNAGMTYPLDAPLGATIEARRITLPEAPLPGFGRDVQLFGVTVDVTGPLPADLRGPELAIWRDAGGILQVEELVLQWGPVAMTAAGAVTLDDALQPQGELRANIQGLDAMIDALVAAGVMDPRQAGFFRFGLTALARRDADGHQTLTVPIILRDRTVFLGPIALGQLPHATWAP